MHKSQMIIYSYILVEDKTLHPWNYVRFILLFQFHSFRVQSDGVRFAKQCLGLNVIDTLQRSASTVQSYLGIARNISESQFQIAGNCSFNVGFSIFEWLSIKKITQDCCTSKRNNNKEMDQILIRNMLVETVHKVLM